MHRFPAIFSALMLLALTTVTAQPRVSYILPDIGAAGMNTYVEIIGPWDGSANFGQPGPGTNNPGDLVRVEPATAADAAKVVVGPLVVGWGGRMISTQIYVKPGAANGPVQLKITANGQSVTTSEFEIVTPQTLGTITGGGVLGSGGLFGVRSKRGAMIVTPLTLSSGTYTVSLNDCDPAAPGNQGYLPFTLICRGLLNISSNAKLVLSAVAQNGGAGGGGGAGNFCDASAFSRPVGDNGGDGYTGGGAGGMNRSAIPGVSDVTKAPGLSTGTSGNAMNGANGGGDSCSYEGSGGGTGHPFGKGGDGFCGGTPAGQYGGGSTTGNSGGGGGGGFATAGTTGSGTNANNNYGRINGNKQGVPVAGGSGGGSGNPQQFGGGGCAGKGGGGGGAAAIYSMLTLNNSGSIEAKGGAGENSTWPGGGGSGGYVGIGAKDRFSFGGPCNVTGGAAGTSGTGNGGAGRVRYDGYTLTAPSIIGTGATSYAGITTDTLTYSNTRFILLRGTYDGTDSLRVYMRSETSPVWVLTALNPTLVPASRSWSVRITLPAVTDRYYFCAVQIVPNPGAGAYDAEPAWVFSQAAANIVEYVLTPIINTDRTSVSYQSVKCTETGLDSVKVWNSGDAPLHVVPSLSPAAGDFVILPPYNVPFTVAPGDTVWMRVQFTPASPGSKVATLILGNDDLRPGVNPVSISLSGRKLVIQPTLGKTIVFKSICKSTSSLDSVRFDYQGEASGSLISITRLGGGPSPFSIVRPTAGQFPFFLSIPRDSGYIVVRFSPVSAGTFVDSFRVVFGPCNDTAVFTVTATGIESVAAIAQGDSIDFGSVRINTTKTLPIVVKNLGASPGVIVRTYYKTPTTVFSDLNPSLVNAALAAMGTPVDSAASTIGFTPPSVGAFHDTLYVIFGQQCPDTIWVIVKGNGVTSLLLRSRTILSLRADTCSSPATPVTDTVKIYNRGFAPEKVTGIIPTNNLVTLAPVPLLPWDLVPDDSIVFTVTWVPTGYGTFTDSITITSNSSDPAQKFLGIRFVMRREHSLVSLADSNGASPASELDLGAVFGCSPSLAFRITARNNGTIPEQLSARMAVGTAFATTSSAVFTLDTAKSRVIGATFSPSVAGDFRDTIIVGTTYCGEIMRQPVRGRRYDLTYNAGAVSFGTVPGGRTNVLPASLRNTSAVPATVKSTVGSFSILPNGAPFTWVPPSGLPQDIGPGESAALNIQFAPLKDSTYNATLCFVVTKPCPDTICIPLTGVGSLQVGLAELDVPDSLTGKPGEHIRIPVLLNNGQLLPQAQVTTIRTVLRFRAALLLPTGVRSKSQLGKSSTGSFTDGAVIVDSRIQGRDRVLTVDFTNTPIPASPDTLGVVEATVLLGDTAMTAITVDSAYARDGLANVSAEGGNFYLNGYCVTGGDRLLQISGRFGMKSVTPNPLGHTAEVQFETIETGPSTLRVHDLYGRPVRTLMDRQALPVGPHSFNWDASEMPSGVYFLELKTVSQNSLLQVVILK